MFRPNHPYFTIDWQHFMFGASFVRLSRGSGLRFVQIYFGPVTLTFNL
jgi:hypothetical protein